MPIKQHIKMFRRRTAPAAEEYAQLAPLTRTTAHHHLSLPVSASQPEHYRVPITLASNDTEIVSHEVGTWSPAFPVERRRRVFGADEIVFGPSPLSSGPPNVGITVEQVENESSQRPLSGWWEGPRRDTVVTLEGKPVVSEKRRRKTGEVFADVRRGIARKLSAIPFPRRKRKRSQSVTPLVTPVCGTGSMVLELTPSLSSLAWDPDHEPLLSFWSPAPRDGDRESAQQSEGTSTPGSFEWFQNALAKGAYGRFDMVQDPGLLDKALQEGIRGGSFESARLDRRFEAAPYNDARTGPQKPVASVFLGPDAEELEEKALTCAALERRLARS